VTIWSLSYFRTCFDSPSAPPLSATVIQPEWLPPFPYPCSFYPLSKR
jgi:hypothetical protein